MVKRETVPQPVPMARPWRVALALALVAGRAVSQDATGATPTADLYSTLTVVERPLATATAAVTVLDRTAIEESGAVSAADVLRFVPGVTVVRQGGLGGLATAQVRGGDPNYTLVLIDGVPVNDGTYPVGDVFNLDTVPAVSIERIEIVRGPISSVYGATGLSGVIQIFTRRYSSNRAEVEVRAGSPRLATGALALGGGDSRKSYFVTLGRDSAARATGQESYGASTLAGNLSYRFDRMGDLAVSVRGADRDIEDYPEASGGPLYGSGELRTAREHEASLGLSWSGGGQTRRQAFQLALYSHDRQRQSPAITDVVPPSDEDARLTRLIGRSTLSLMPQDRLAIHFGLEVAHDRADSRSRLEFPEAYGGDVRGDYELSRTTPAAFSELSIIKGGLCADFAARVDVPKNLPAEWSPRIGIRYQRALDSGLWSLRLSYGTAFKLPSFFALASPAVLGGNPNLRPERMRGGEIGVDWRDAAARAEGGLTLFAARYTDLVDFDFDTFQHVNRSRVRAQGAELHAGARFGARLHLAADVTWQLTQDLLTGLDLLHRPEWSATVRLSCRASERLDLHVDMQGVSSSSDRQIPVPERERVDATSLWGLAAAWKPPHAEAWRLEARVDNLTDRRYERLIGFPAPGRSVALRIRWGGGDTSREAP